MSNMAMPAGMTEPKLTSYLISISAIEKWPAPNLTNPETRTWLIPFSIVLELLATVALVCRLRARINKLAGGFGADDVLMIGSWVFGTVFTALVIFGVSSAGFDRHIWDQNFKVTATGGLIGILTEVTFLLSTCATKISILLFYRRLVDRSVSKVLQWSIYGGLGFTLAYFFSFMIFLATFCTPSSASWQSLDLNYTKKYTCADRVIVDPLVGLVSAFSDIYAIVIPEIVVLKLKIPKRRKIVLYLIFGAGSIVVIAALIRTAFFVQLHTDPRRDLTWIGYEIFVWTTIELQLAIVYACVPALKALVSSRPSRTNGSYGGTTAIGSSGKRRGTVVDEIPLNDLPKRSRSEFSSALQTIDVKASPKGVDLQKDSLFITVTETVDVATLKWRASIIEEEEEEAYKTEVAASEHSFLHLDRPSPKGMF